MSLIVYHQKRNFKKTPEPLGKKTQTKTQKAPFVVQKHAASHLHYDFRLALKGVLASWAVPKGPCLDPSVKRLAVHVEDHPLEYAHFEGIIPAGQYGGGTVIIWDEGIWISEDKNPIKAYHDGHMTFTLEGEKLKGKWKLIRIRKDDKSWLLIKVKDEFSKSLKNYDITLKEPRSVVSGEGIEEVSEHYQNIWNSHQSSKKVIKSKRTPKIDIDLKPKPFPKKIAVQLATLVDKAPIGKNWLHEIKFDGYRILAFKQNNKTSLWTRNQQNWTEKFSLIAKEINKLPIKNAIFDGEVVVLDENQHSNFQLLQNSIKENKENTCVYYAFDLLYYDQYLLTTLPLIKRKEILHRLIPSSTDPVLRYSDHVVGSGNKVLQKACRLGLEGIVCKDAESSYIQKRSKSWLKVKCLKRQEFVIGGFTKPSGSRSCFGALLLGTYGKNKELLYNGKVGTGFTESSLQTIYELLIKNQTDQSPFSTKPPGSKAAVWVKPNVVVEIEFTEWTNGDRLRHPSFKGLRKDKPARAVTRESETPVEEVAKPSKYPLSHPEKLFYPQDKITKADLAEYYETVAPWILPFLINRPLTLVRCPSNYEKCFYQKHLYESSVSGLHRIRIKEKKSTEEGIYIQDESGLMALTQLNTLEIHPWGSKIEKIEYPDMVTFDLDPGPGVPWKKVVQTAFEFKKHLAEFNLKSFVKTTGGKGLHVVVPIQPEYQWDTVKQFAHVFVDFMVLQNPEHYVSTMTKTKRKGKIFLDYLRNQRGSTAVASYSTRAREHAPVATPIDWSELTDHIQDTFYTIKTLPNRLRHLKKDPWKDFFKLSQSLNLDRLENL